MNIFALMPAGNRISENGISTVKNSVTESFGEFLTKSKNPE